MNMAYSSKLGVMYGFKDQIEYTPQAVLPGEVLIAEMDEEIGKMKGVSCVLAVTFNFVLISLMVPLACSRFYSLLLHQVVTPHVLAGIDSDKVESIRVRRVEDASLLPGA